MLAKSLPSLANEISKCITIMGLNSEYLPPPLQYTLYTVTKYDSKSLLGPMNRFNATELSE